MTAAGVCSSLRAVVLCVCLWLALGVLCCKQRSDDSVLQDKPGCDCCAEWQARV